VRLNAASHAEHDGGRAAMRRTAPAANVVLTSVLARIMPALDDDPAPSKAAIELLQPEMLITCR